MSQFNYNDAVFSSYKNVPMDGYIRVLRADNREVIWQSKNIIVNVVKFLFARLLANALPNAPGVPYTLGQAGVSADPLYGIWGLALGAGSPSWAGETQPNPSPVQTALISEFLRKPLSAINYVDVNFNPVNQFSTTVDFETTVNATTDNVTQAIREMGLIGGGTLIGAGGQPTNMETAPYFNPIAAPPGPADSVVLVNYITLPPLLLPAGVDIIFSWILSF